MPMSRKIRFIEPQARAGRPFNVWLERWPLLGPITLATILEERGYDAEVYNENVSGSLLDNPKAYADICSSDVVGITIMTPTAARGYTLADRIKADAPNVTVAFGGTHATFLPEEALPHGDIVCCGEGERAIEAIARGDIKSGILRPQPLENLDELPTLNHALMRDFDKLLAKFPRKSNYPLPVMSSRGCPHNCDYCSVTRVFGHKVRRQSVEKVYKDLAIHRERGFGRVFFYDDNFTSDHAYSRELLGRIKPLDLQFHAQTRVDFAWCDAKRKRLDNDLLCLMREAGGDVLYIGYETIDDAMAKEWHKGYQGEGTLVNRLQQDTKILHDNGFWIHSMFIFGPDHSRNDATRIVDFARDNKIESLQISILTPFPGTPLFERMLPNLLLKKFPEDWDFYDGSHCVYDHGRLGIEDLQRAVLKAHRNFYRWSSISLKRIRALMHDRLSLAEKMSTVLQHARMARTVLKQWQLETNRFIELVRERTARDGISKAAQSIWRKENGLPTT